MTFPFKERTTNYLIPQFDPFLVLISLRLDCILVLAHPLKPGFGQFGTAGVQQPALLGGTVGTAGKIVTPGGDANIPVGIGAAGALSVQINQAVGPIQVPTPSVVQAIDENAVVLDAIESGQRQKHFGIEK